MLDLGECQLMSAGQAVGIVQQGTVSAVADLDVNDIPMLAK